MDYYKNADKLDSYILGVTYNQVSDIDRGTVTTEPVTLNELKNYCKIAYSTDDALLTALITAARQVCENYSYVALAQREITAWINNFNGGTYLPYGPVGDIILVEDLDGNPVTDYTTSGGQFKQILTPFEPLVVTYEGGYSTTPDFLKVAIMAQALYMYENRGDAQRDTLQGTSPVATLILNTIKRV